MILILHTYLPLYQVGKNSAESLVEANRNLKQKQKGISINAT